MKTETEVVYLLIPTSNHNCHEIVRYHIPVVYLLIPTSNHNSIEGVNMAQKVVYLLIPTSNHNYDIYAMAERLLYIF